MRPLSRHLLAVACALLVAACDATAQAKLSEPAVVAQTVDGTKITVEYSRPSMRGRGKIFGGEVHWDEVWTPGANWATTLETDKDVTLEGRAVAKGKYSVWLVVKEQGEWTLVLAKEAKLWHTNRPTPKDELTIPVAPQWAAQGAPPVETLTWDFPVVKPDRTVLRLQWGTLIVPLRIGVQASRTLTAEQRARVVGTWALTRSSAERAASQPARTELRITDEGGRLRARLTPALVGYDAAFDLFAVGGSMFFPVYYDRSGAPAGAESDLTLFFEFDDGKVKELTVSDAAGTLMRGPAK